MLAGPLCMLSCELAQTEFAPLIEQAGSALTVTVLAQVLLHPFASVMVSVNV
jgi:hypothetical protein